MLWKQFHLIYSRRITKHQHISLLLKTNGAKCCSTANYNNRKKHKFDGPGLKDFIAKDFSAGLSEPIHDEEDTIPYVDAADLGQERKGKIFTSSLLLGS